MTRIAVIGSPRAGKTSLALELGGKLSLPVLHADDLMFLGWSECSDAIATRMRTGAQCIYEGVAVVRAMRKVLIQEPDLAPVERCIVLTKPRIPRLSERQDSMRKACASILATIEPELVRRGVVIQRDPESP